MILLILCFIKMGQKLSILENLKATWWFLMLSIFKENFLNFRLMLQHYRLNLINHHYNKRITHTMFYFSNLMKSSRIPKIQTVIIFTFKLKWFRITTAKTPIRTLNLFDLSLTLKNNLMRRISSLKNEFWIT